MIYSVIVAVMLALDIPWVVLNGKFGVYRDQLVGSRRWALPIIWVAMVLLNAALLARVIGSADWRRAAVWGALTGAAVYFTFNGTALMTNAAWTARLAAIDTLWGVLLFGAAAVAAAVVAARWKSRP